MSKLCLPPTIVKQVDKYRKHCLWRGAEINARKPPMAAWPLVYKSKKKEVLVGSEFANSK
jgi:hypothetical protein